MENCSLTAKNFFSRASAAAFSLQVICAAFVNANRNVIREEYTMSNKDQQPKSGRRQFLGGVIAAGAAAGASTVAPQVAKAADAPARAPSALPPSSRTAAFETQVPAPLAFQLRLELSRPA